MSSSLSPSSRVLSGRFIPATAMPGGFQRCSSITSSSHFLVTGCRMLCTTPAQRKPRSKTISWLAGIQSQRFQDSRSIQKWVAII